MADQPKMKLPATLGDSNVAGTIRRSGLLADGCAVEEEDGCEAGEDGEGDEVGAHLEAHDDEAGVHLEIEEEHRHEEHVDHVPFVDRLQLEERLAGGEPQHEFDVFENRKDEGEDQDDAGDQIVAALPEHADRIEERDFLASDLEAHHLVFGGHQRIAEAEDVEHDGGEQESGGHVFPGLPGPVLFDSSSPS